MAAAHTRMKALVASRLMMGDIRNWSHFESERTMAGRIANRHAARSVSSQIGRGYRELSGEVKLFIEQNFLSCSFDNLAQICDELKPGIGLSLRLDEFERKFFPLAESVKRRFPMYAHISITTHGLRFEFPEHYFLGDIETALPELLDVRSRMKALADSDYDSTRDGIFASGLKAKEQFLSRSVISAAFNLVEAFLSGLLFSAVHTRSIGRIACDEEFLKFAEKRESAPLRDRVDHVVRFTSKGMSTYNDEPFRTLIKTGKHHRDAIHHSTPFQRKDIEPGGRLTALYEIDCALALRCAESSVAALFNISQWIGNTPENNDVAGRCDNLVQRIRAASRVDRAPIG